MKKYICSLFFFSNARSFSCILSLSLSRSLCPYVCLPLSLSFPSLSPSLYLLFLRLSSPLLLSLLLPLYAPTSSFVSPSLPSLSLFPSLPSLLSISFFVSFSLSLLSIWSVLVATPRNHPKLTLVLSF